MPFPVLLLFSLLVVQTVATGVPGRFGAVGRQLTDAEVGQISQIANEAGKPPWLIVGFPSMVRGISGLTVYLQPDATAGLVQRGGLLRLVADSPPVVSSRSAWRVSSSDSYAYVAPSGRPVGSITDDGDVAWPFAVRGALDDETLLSLVEFIRSSPPIPGVPQGLAPREVDGTMPLSSVVRVDEEFTVALRTGPATGQRVKLVRRDGRWVITHVESWIV